MSHAPIYWCAGLVRSLCLGPTVLKGFKRDFSSQAGSGTWVSPQCTAHCTQASFLAAHTCEGLVLHPPVTWGTPGPWGPAGFPQHFHCSPTGRQGYNSAAKLGCKVTRLPQGTLCPGPQHSPTLWKNLQTLSQKALPFLLFNTDTSSHCYTFLVKFTPWLFPLFFFLSRSDSLSVWAPIASSPPPHLPRIFLPNSM